MLRMHGAYNSPLLMCLCGGHRDNLTLTAVTRVVIWFRHIDSNPRSQQGHGYLSVVSVVYCQVEVSVTS